MIALIIGTYVISCLKRYCSLYLAVAATLNVNPAVVTVENNFVLERPPHSEEEEEDTDELDGDIEDGHCLESEGISISIVLFKFRLIIF